MEPQANDSASSAHLWRGWRWCRRNPAVTALSAALIFALLAGITASTYFAVQERYRARESDANAARAESSAREAESRAQDAREYAAKLQVSEAQEKANAKMALEAQARAEESARQAMESQRQAEVMSQKAIDAKARETVARVDALLPDAQFSKEDISYLESQVRTADANLQICNARYDAGTVTGADTSEAKAGLCIAKGRVAWAKGDLPQCLKDYNDAVVAWKQRADILRAQYQVGTVDYTTLLAAEALEKETELCASKVKGRIAREPKGK